MAKNIVNVSHADVWVYSKLPIYATFGHHNQWVLYADSSQHYFPYLEWSTRKNQDITEDK